MRRRYLSVIVLLLAATVGQAADPLESAKAAIRLKDYESAVRLLNEQRSAGAQYLLGTLYLAGLGVSADSERAQALFESAAMQGDARAAFAMSGLLSHKQSPDLDGARHWRDRAAELKFAPAIELKKRDALPLAFQPQLDLTEEATRHAAFLRAAANDDVEMLKALSNKKWMFDADEFGRVPLHLAAERGASGSIDWLVRQGAPIDVADRFGVTPAMLAASNDSTCLRRLLEAKPRLSAVDAGGNNALMYAARTNRVENLKLLLDAGMSPAAKNINGWSAIDFALLFEASQAAELLRSRGAVPVRRGLPSQSIRSSEIERAPSKMRDLYSDWSDLAIAVSRDDPALIGEIVQRGAKVDPSLLSVAAETASPKSAHELIGRGANPVWSDAKHRTALIAAIEHGHVATVQSLLAAGVRPDAHGDDEPTPLIAAIRTRQPSVVRDLLRSGADPNLVFAGETAIMEAAQRGQIESVNDLIAAHATVDTVDASGRSALWFAAQLGEARIVAALLQASAPVDAADQLGVTPLLIACANGRREAVDRLLSRGASVRVRSKSGDTPLIAAAATGNLEIVELVIKQKPELDAQNARGDTALIAASRAGHEKVVAGLIASGVSSKLRNNEKIAAEDVAKARGFERIVAMIRRR